MAKVDNNATIKKIIDRVLFLAISAFIEIRFLATQSKITQKEIITVSKIFPSDSPNSFSNLKKYKIEYRGPGDPNINQSYKFQSLKFEKFLKIHKNVQTTVIIVIKYIEF